MADEIIEDALLRERVRLLLRRYGTERSNFSAVLAHPLMTVIIGFILTSLVAGWVSNRYNEAQRALADNRARSDRELFEQRAAYEASTKAAQEFAALAYRRQTRATMLQSSLIRPSTIDELRQRKRSYDEAMAEWGSLVQSNLFMIRKITSQADYQQLEASIENDLTPAFADVDDCLTRAFDAREHNESVDRVFLDCNLHDRMRRQFRMCYVVTDRLFKAAAASTQQQPRPNSR